MTVRRAHSENRVAILEGRSDLMTDLMTPWSVLPLVPRRSIFSIDNLHRDRSETFPRVRYDNLEVRSITLTN